jgi:hypothetical protein
VWTCIQEHQPEVTTSGSQVSLASSLFTLSLCPQVGQDPEWPPFSFVLGSLSLFVGNPPASQGTLACNLANFFSLYSFIHMYIHCLGHLTLQIFDWDVSLEGLKSLASCFQSWLFDFGAVT